MDQVFPKAFRRFLDQFLGEYKGLRANAGAGQRAPRGTRGENAFVGHAPYVLGDDLRHVDWNAYGRSDKLFLKLFAAEESREMRILLDTSASMGHEEAKRHFALRMTALIGATALAMGVPLSIRASGKRFDFQEKREITKLLKGLEALPFAQGESRYWQGRLTNRAGEASGARNLVVISDCLEDLVPRSALQALSAKGRRLTLLALLGANEADPTFNQAITGAVLMEDAESGESLSGDIDQAAIRSYRHHLAEHFRAWQQAARACGADFLEFDARRSVPEIAREAMLSSQGGALL